MSAEAKITKAIEQMQKEIEVAMTAGMIDHIAKTDPAVAAEMRAMLRPDGTVPD